jgi:beta-glucosidase
LSSPTAVTVYDADFITQRPITNLDLRAQGGVTYRYFQGEPLWPFGHGVSYGHFEFEPAAPDAILKTTVSTSSDNPLCFNVTVNAAKGGMVSDVVVLGFLQPQHQSAIDSITKKLPNPQLCDFTRLAAVAPGTERKVSLCVDGLGPGLQHVSEDGSKTVLPGEYVMTVGVKSKGSVGGSGAGAVIGKVLVSA